jgi:DNA polymerase III sliding clamp (beta) subunit (PCNA family)
MTRRAVFEVTTLADAVMKANRVAPTKGAPFDRAAGIVIDVDPYRAETVLVMATDLDVTLRMSVSPLEIGDEAVVWRVPNKLIHGLLGSLPMNTGAKIELLDTGDHNLYMKSGKTKGKIRLIVGSYPSIEEFPTSDMLTAPSLAARLAQVAWATDKRGTGVLSGVHMDGEYLYACNRASAAIVPCTVPLEAPVTAPLTEVSQIIRNTGEVSIRATSTKLHLMPDPYTQATCVLFMDAYPKIEPLLTKAPLEHEFEMACEPIMAMIDRTMVLMKEERAVATNIEIGDGYLKMSMSTDAGLVVDELEIKGGTPEPLKVSFSPDQLRSALQASGRPNVTVKYGPTHKDPFLISDDGGFRALMMPIVRPVA